MISVVHDIGPRALAPAEITAAHAKIFAQAFDVALAYIVAGFKAFEGVPSDDEVDDLVEQGLKRAGSVLDANIFE